MRLQLYIVFLALVLSLSDSALAQDNNNPLGRPTSAEAKKRYIAGNRLWRIREFEKAIDEYKEGMKSEPAAVFHYNLAQCYRQLGEYQESIWHYEQFLTRARPPANMKTDIEVAIREMTNELTRRAMTRPPLEPIAEPKQASVAEQPPKVVATPRSSAPWYRDTLGWSLAGAGVMSVGLSTGLLISAASLTDDANDEVDQDTQRKMFERADDRRLLGILIGAGGGVVLAAGIVKLVGRAPFRYATRDV